MARREDGQEPARPIEAARAALRWLWNGAGGIPASITLAAAFTQSHGT